MGHMRRMIHHNKQLVVMEHNVGDVHEAPKPSEMKFGSLHGLTKADVRPHKILDPNCSLES